LDFLVGDPRTRDRDTRRHHSSLSDHPVLARMPHRARVSQWHSGASRTASRRIPPNATPLDPGSRQAE
jgi:hypothetical protein